MYRYVSLVSPALLFLTNAWHGMNKDPTESKRQPSSSSRFPLEGMKSAECAEGAGQLAIA